MNALKNQTKKPSKTDREKKVLLSLVEQYIQTGKPVGSHTLKDLIFEDLSSATIRNYFANLEEKGFLIQQHSSGGRIPTDKAYHLYATEYLDEEMKIPLDFELPEMSHNRAISHFLQNIAEQLALDTTTAVFLSAPRFEQDFIVKIKFLPIDASRSICIILTDFGEIKTEILYTKEKLGTIASKRLEDYFSWRLTGHNKPEHLSKSEEEWAQKIYSEILIRYIVSYSQFNEEEIYRTGFSSLLTYPEFKDPLILSNTLTLFENTRGMRLLLKECIKFNELKFWIGSELSPYSTHETQNSTAIAIPYCVNNHPVGAIGIFGPARLPYRSLFGILRQFSEHISKILTNIIYKFKITLHQPKKRMIDTDSQPQLITHESCALLEDKRHHIHKPETKKNHPNKHLARRK